MRLNRRVLAPVAMAAALLTAGCASRQQPLYRWGAYEQLVYDMYLKPGTADPGTQAAKLSADVARTLAEGKRVPPGVHAHLGYMYSIQGNRGAAIDQFVAEKKSFPESSLFVDRILNRLSGGTP